MKKIIWSILLAGTLAIITGGCGSSILGGGSSDNLKLENQVVLRTVSMFGGDDANMGTYQAICKEFMKENPNITIEDNSQPADEEWKTMVNTDFSVGNEPDVIQFFTDATADSIVATDKLVPIEEIRAEYPEYAAGIYDSALEAAKNTDGVLRAVPTTSYWEGLYCNKDLFDKYGLEIPTDWASLEHAIITFRNNGIIPIACSLNSVPHYWIEYLMLYSSGIEGYTIIPQTAPEDWSKGLALFQTLREMKAFPENTDTVDSSYTSQLFRDKKAAMQLDGSWFAASIEDTENTVVVGFPGVPEQKANPNTIVGGISSGFYITRKAWENPNKREAAVKFVMAQTCRDSIERYWEATGGVTKPVAELDCVVPENPFAESITAYTESAVEIVAPTDSRIGGAYKTLVSKIVKISTGSLSAEDAINQALKTGMKDE